MEWKDLRRRNALVMPKKTPTDRNEEASQGPKNGIQSEHRKSKRTKAGMKMELKDTISPVENSEEILKVK